MIATLTHEEKVRAYQRSQVDSPWWIRTCLGVRLWDIQAAIAQSVADNPRTTVRSCSGSGKSFDAACIALWFLECHYPSTVITTAPTFRQVESILWREIAGRFTNAVVPLPGKFTAVGLDIEDKWFAIGLSTDEPERFQGFHNKYVLVIGDEASGLGEEVYTAIENPLSAGYSRLLLIGNPTQSVGSFRNSFTSEIYRSFHISAFDTPNFTAFGITLEDIVQDTWRDKIAGRPLPYPSLVTPQWVSERFKEWGKGSLLFQVYVLGNFPEAGVDNLFSLSAIEGCVNKGINPQGEIVAALDVARYGDDESVFCAVQGRKILALESWSHQDTVFTAGRAARYIREWRPAIMRVDSVGVGGGVADILRAEGHGIEDCNVGVPALDTEQFANKRAEWYWLLSRQMVEGKWDIPNNPKLKSQLADVRYKYNLKGQLIIESKEDARKRGSKSPDHADALMMCFTPETVKVLKAQPVWRF